MKVRTRQGDVLDALLFERLGRHADVGAVLEANPGLAARGPVLPAGLEIDLPEPGAAGTAPVATPVRLWGRS